MTTLTIWLVTLAVVGVLLGLTALAFRGGNPTKRSMDSAERGDGRGGDQLHLTAKNRFNQLGG